MDPEGFHHNLLEVILDYKKESNAVEKDEMYITTKSGARHMRKTTAGWKLLVQWKKGEDEWIPLNILKEPNPIEVT